MSAQTATVLYPGEGAKYWLVGDQATFKLTGEKTGDAFAFAENYCAPQQGPPPHVHHNEDEYFYVIEGTMMFGLGDRTMVRGAGSAMFLPRGVPHMFKNVGATPARFLLLVTPGGFERMVMAAGEAIDRIGIEKAVSPADIEKLLTIVPKFGIEIRPDWKPAGTAPEARADRKLWCLGQHVAIKLNSQDTNGTFTLAEITSYTNERVPPHVHVEMDEVFYTLEGTWEFTLADRTVVAPPGTFVHVPKGVAHSFRNAGIAPARLVDYHFPGGFERFFEECGVPALEGSSTPHCPAPDRQTMAGMLRKHGMEMT
jgi:mannose-6-phosphate isomerase-like protein (cupin superfamily)